MALFVTAALTGCGDGDSASGPDPDPEPNPPTPSEDTYAIGDYYEKGFIKGIVFQVDESGQHGYILALEETSAVWSYKGEDTMSGIPSDNGMTNCKRIYAKENWKENYPGFLWAYEMNVMGLENWYVPSGLEYSKIYEAYTGQKPDDTGEGLSSLTSEAPTDREEHKAWFNARITEKGGTPLSDDIYWTSGEMGLEIAYPFDMRTGYHYIDYQDMVLKTKVYKFRAISKF